MQMVELNKDGLKIHINAIYTKDPRTGLMTNKEQEEFVVLEEKQGERTQILKKHLEALHGKPEKDWIKAGLDVKRLRKLKVIK
jgi:hypothetical protein